MFFSRLFRKKSVTGAEESPRNDRSEYRIQLPAGAPLKITLRREDESEFATELLDMTLRGLRFRRRDADPDNSPEGLALHEVVEVVVSAEGAPLLRTPGLLRWRSAHEDGVQWGLEFINLGNLYGQWENFLGQFMNRRAQVRIPLACDKPLVGRLRFEGTALTAQVYDLSSKGVGLLVSHAEAGGLRMDETARISFKLPKCGEVSGMGILRSRRCIDTRDVVGAEFDLSDADGFVRHQERIAAYCAEREGELARWEGSWEARGKDAA